MSVQPKRDLTGVTVGGKFRITARLARGGMGTVYRALDLKLDREVALKIVHLDAAADPSIADRFDREAKVLAGFAHPNLPIVFAYGLEEGLGYLALELVQGWSLAQILSTRGLLPAPRACHLATQILAALGAAHERGVIHRDVKPANVMVAEVASGEVVKLVDFGLAKTNRPLAHPTGPKIIVGTPNYMSPEQACGRVDARSDLYSLGVVLYEMLSGRRPFQGTIAEVLSKQNREAPPPLPPHVPPLLALAVMTVLQKDPERRFPDARSFAAALAPFAVNAPAPAGPVPTGDPDPTPSSTPRIEPIAFP